MNVERTLTDWLHAEAPRRASDQVLERTLATVAVVSQERVFWRRRPFASRAGRSWRPVLALAAALVALSLMAGSLALIGGDRPVPTNAPAIVTATGSPESQSSPGTGVGLVYAVDGDIYVADADAANPVRIFDGENVEDCWAVFAGLAISPDGRLIAYRSGGNACPGVVHVIDAAGDAVASFPGEGWQIAWSPDSTRIATWLGFGQTIGVYGVDGERQATLDGSLMCCGDYDPMWSPDGADVLLVKTGGPAGIVHELPLDGGAARPVSADDPRSWLRSWREGQVAYSPDGTRVAGINAGALTVAHVDGTDANILITDPESYDLSGVMWSPSGDLIAYVEASCAQFDPAEGCLLEPKMNLRLADPETGLITAFATPEGATGLDPIAFSPDGDEILYRPSAGEGGALWIAATDASNRRLLVDDASDGGWISLP